MCASKTCGYQGFKSFAMQHCPTLKPGESYEQRATKFSSMGSKIVAPSKMNRMGNHAYESVAMQNGQQVQPEDYRVPDRRGVGIINQKTPRLKPFIATSTYMHDFAAFDQERKRILNVQLEKYEKAFRHVEISNNVHDHGAIIQFSQVREVLELALGNAVAPHVIAMFINYLNRRGNSRNHITWSLFSEAVDHVHSLLNQELNQFRTSSDSESVAEKQRNDSLVRTSTPASSHQIDFGRYGDCPRDRPYMRKRGMASTTTDLNQGTSRATYQVPGYGGFIPRTLHSAPAVAQSNGEVLHPVPQSDLRLFHTDNIPGYTGHKPTDCANYRGECRAGK